MNFVRGSFNVFFFAGPLKLICTKNLLSDTSQRYTNKTYFMFYVFYENFSGVCSRDWEEKNLIVQKKKNIKLYYILRNVLEIRQKIFFKKIEFLFFKWMYTFYVIDIFERPFAPVVEKDDRRRRRYSWNS